MLLAILFLTISQVAISYCFYLVYASDRNKLTATLNTMNVSHANIHDTLTKLLESVNRLSKDIAIVHNEISTKHAETIDLFKEIHGDVLRFKEVTHDNFVNQTGQIRGCINETFNRQSEHIDIKNNEIVKKLEELNISNRLDSIEKQFDEFNYENVDLIRKINYIFDYISAKKNHRKVNKDPGNTCNDGCKKD